MKSALASLDNYLTYYFVSYEKSSTDGQSTEVISAVDCLEKYAEGDDIQTKKLVDQFQLTSDNMSAWICPNVTEFSLLNNPATYDNGKSFKLVIDYCDEETNPDCITNTA